MGGKADACRQLFASTHATEIDVFDVLDNINCAPSPMCNEAMTWFSDFNQLDTALYHDKKGRHSAAPSDIMWRDVDPSDSSYTGGITDRTLGCPIKGLIDFFKGASEKEVAQGKLFLTRSGVGITSIFRACATPFVGGISGTTALYLKQLAGTLGAEHVTSEALATIMSMLVAGGDHALIETSLTVQHFLTHFTKLANKPGSRLNKVGFPAGQHAYEFPFQLLVHTPFDHNGIGNCSHYDAATDRADFVHATEDSGPYVAFLHEHGLWAQAVFHGAKL